MVSNLLNSKIKGQMLDRINQIVLFAQRNSKLYAALYGNKPYELTEIEDIEKIPFLRREELAKYYPFDHLCVDKNHIISYFETTGTTGHKIPVVPNLSYEKMSDFGLFLDFWMNIKNEKIKIAMVALPYEANPMGLKYHMALNSLNVTTIPVSVRNILCPPYKVITLIKDLEPDLLVGRPLEVMRYGEYLEVAHIDSSLRKIFLTGETMSENKWRRIDELYGGVDIYSTYGLTELDTGLISCSQHHYHLPNSASLVVEIIDEYGKAVREGELGEIVITNTEMNFAPMIRYKTGDLGKFFSSGDCEFDTPYVEIMGREVDLKQIDGRLTFPVEIENTLYSLPDTGCEYQLIINNNKLKIKIEKANRSNILKADLAYEIASLLYQKLSIHADVEVFEFNTLADKLGIAIAKGCRFVDITNLSSEEVENAIRINLCEGDKLI